MPSKGMRRAALLLATLSFAGATPAWAAVTLNGSWLQERELETELPSAGYGVGLSFDMGPYAFLGLNYSLLRTDSFEDALDGVEGRLEYRSGSIDLGGVWPWTDHLGATITGGYARSETHGLDGFRHDRPARFDGPTGSLTLWTQLGDLALNVGRGYSYIGAVPGWDTAAGLGLRLWGEVWLDGGYWRSEASEGWSAGLRMTFAGN
jgi:hypothetical protein